MAKPRMYDDLIAAGLAGAPENKVRDTALRRSVLKRFWKALNEPWSIPLWSLLLLYIAVVIVISGFTAHLLLPS
jgi:hypothetical protein